jgi:signal transduction histidine kinase
MLWVTALVTATVHAVQPRIGLPITRAYSIEEIGVTRGPHLNFDRLGRLAVIGGGSYLVLNDSAWIDLHDKQPGAPILFNVAHTPDGRSYFGALARWGIATYTAEGNIVADSLRPAQYPAWINATNFTHIIPVSDSILFSGVNGIVHFHPASGEQRFHHIPDVAITFTLKDVVYVSTHTRGTMRLDLESGELHPVDPATTIHLTSPTHDGRILASTTGSRLVYFDGREFTDLGLRFREERQGSISSLHVLPDDGFAVALDGEGLYLFSQDGDCRMALTTTGYRRIYDLASREPGVLWIAMESSVEKLLYNDPVSVIDQRSDVIIGWPQVLQWGDRPVIASNGRLYDVALAADQRNYTFTEVRETPLGGAWAVAANQNHLLVGNNDGVFARTPSGFTRIPGAPGASRLYLQDEDLCLVVSNREIVAMRWADGAWAECAEPVAGVGFPAVALPSPLGLWIELGLDRAARIWFEDGQVHTQVFEEFPWEDPTWINIGIIDDVVILSGANNRRVYVDQRTGEFIPAPPLEGMLAQCPVTILRLAQDAKGVIWITHPNGVVTLHRDHRDYRYDTESLASIRDLYPIITLLNREDAWISTESALYHVVQRFAIHPAPVAQPFLVSVRDGKSGLELLSATQPHAELPVLPYSRNHLEFRYFSGGYTFTRNPTYEYSMQSGSASWSVQSSDSLLTLPQLEEGHYRLTAQVRYGDRTIGNPVVTSFTIRPPWYRSRVAQAGYWTAGLVLCFGLAAWVAGRARRKHEALEVLIRERTDELRATLEKLTEEARTSATLAERNRLAGEIHDSLQQGLSGLALHLETTLRKDTLDADLRARLNVARKMVSYTRQEVQQAVWDLESPLLENDSLTAALQNIADLIGTETTRVTVDAPAEEAEVSSTVKHHLLRIAQEGITNAVRHSGAAHVHVRLHYTETEAFLAVKDDGKGFVIDDVLTGGIGHFGLRGLRSRAQKINGDLHIVSELGQGTEVSIAVPFENRVPVPQEIQ